MTSDRSIIERQIERVELEPFTIERFHQRRNRMQRNRRIGTAVVALAVAAAGIGSLARTFSTDPVPAGDPRRSFLGNWVSTDADGSSQSMSVRASEDGAVVIVVRDHVASMCSEGASTMTGTGRLEGTEQLVIPSPMLTCDDGSELTVEDGPPLEELLRNLTFMRDPEADTLTDSFGVVWDRAETDPTVIDFPALRTTFVSPRNGFSIKHPDRAALTPAVQLWGFSKQVDDGFDVVETGVGVVFKGASTGPGFGGQGSIDERVDEYLSDDFGNLRGCGVPRSQQAEITIDGQTGTVAECPNRIEATVVAGGRLYLFTLEHDRRDARAVFDAFVATIDLTPETAVDYPGLTTTFVSPTYGYSFGYIDRGGLEPAKEHWDPADQPPIDEDVLGAYGAEYADGFDTVQTGLGAFFMSASTEIPDGLSIDEWVDDAVAKYLPAGCYVPRRQQAPITIDGQSGRIAECPEDIVATVVVDGRLYLFMLAHDGTDVSSARAFFDVWVDTIELTPETATG